MMPIREPLSKVICPDRFGDADVAFCDWKKSDEPFSAMAAVSLQRFMLLPAVMPLPSRLSVEPGWKT